MADTNPAPMAPETLEILSSLIHDPPTPPAKPVAKRLRTIAANIFPALEELDSADVSRVMTRIFELKKTKELEETQAKLSREVGAPGKQLGKGLDFGTKDAIDILTNAILPVPQPVVDIFSKDHQHMENETNTLTFLHDSARRMVVRVKRLNNLLFALAGRVKTTDVHLITDEDVFYFKGISPDPGEGVHGWLNPLEEEQSDFLQVTLAALYCDKMLSYFIGGPIEEIFDDIRSSEKIKLQVCFEILEDLSSQLTLFTILQLFVCHCVEVARGDGGYPEKGRAEAKSLLIDYYGLSTLRYAITPPSSDRDTPLKYNRTQVIQKASMGVLRPEMDKWLHPTASTYVL
ncbi:hypothetical protein GGR53DRAFT_515650 [Hypoxylon sp. FL1150]|nr:hypothetical protein GGR53DRAFT_515650 [Hypoxylon sp. FL1150]